MPNATEVLANIRKLSTEASEVDAQLERQLAKLMNRLIERRSIVSVAAVLAKVARERADDCEQTTAGAEKWEAAADLCEGLENDLDCVE